MNIKLSPYHPSSSHALSDLSVHPEQAQFTASNLSLLIPSLSDDERPFLILSQAHVVGFFILDLAYSVAHPFCTDNSIGIRSLLIDQRHQGQGIAVKALGLLPHYVKKNMPKVQKIYLTVNCRNQGAYRCYLKSGFIDSRELYLAGPVGPQQIMYQVID